MVGTQDPALKQRGHAVHARHGDVGGDVRPEHHGALVEIAGIGQRAVGGRAIGMHGCINPPAPPRLPVHGRAPAAGILCKRKQLYSEDKAKHPERWAEWT